jgi:hypothetical protein
MDDAALTAAFCRWVRRGMTEPAPSFEGLRDSLYFVPADVTQILTRERGLTNFWNYGQAVKQLAGEPPETDAREGLAHRIGFLRTSPHGE